MSPVTRILRTLGQLLAAGVLAPSGAAPATCPSSSWTWLGQVPRIFARYA